MRLCSQCSTASGRLCNSSDAVAALAPRMPTWEIVLRRIERQQVRGKNHDSSIARKIISSVSFCPASFFPASDFYKKLIREKMISLRNTARAACSDFEGARVARPDAGTCQWCSRPCSRCLLSSCCLELLPSHPCSLPTGGANIITLAAEPSQACSITPPPS
jgi:hypothetical protein